MTGRGPSRPCIPQQEEDLVRGDRDPRLLGLTLVERQRSSGNLEERHGLPPVRVVSRIGLHSQAGVVGGFLLDLTVRSSSDVDLTMWLDFTHLLGSRSRRQKILSLLLLGRTGWEDGNLMTVGKKFPNPLWL